MSNNIFSLENKVAIVTGACGLLGQNHCKALSYAGANVIALDLDDSKCREIVQYLPTYSIGAVADICCEQSLNELSEKILEKFGKIDILINNAAINDMVEKNSNQAEDSKFENFSYNAFKKVMDVNVGGMFLCSQIFGKAMLKNKGGSIINVASTYGVVAPDQSIYQKPDGTQSFFKTPAYPTSKGAVLSFTRFLASYWGNHGIRVNSLSPGGVLNNQEEYFIDNYIKRTPLKRMANPEDYLGAVVFLASDASSYMTGANLIVDGGWTCW